MLQLPRKNLIFMKEVYRIFKRQLIGAGVAYLLCATAACSKKDSQPVVTPPVDTVVVVNPNTPFDINSIGDTYGSIAPFAYHDKWASYNVHDPSIKKFGDYYYCYSTDVGFGLDGSNLPAGLQVR